MLLADTKIGPESTSATRVSSTSLGQMTDSLLDVSRVTDLTLNVLKGVPNLGEEALWFGRCFHVKKLVG